ncbi:hypothetical protein HRbin11_01917 [bacterium HR11]|nr:hypothetical protein HRbin11_01917 [bacterium HR11]
MAKVSIFILAGPGSEEGLGRVANALVAAKELKERGHTVEVVFDGAATRWIPELLREGSRLGPLFQAVRDQIAGACGHCAGAFGVKDRLAQVPALEEFEGHPSVAERIAAGFQILTF